MIPSGIQRLCGLAALLCLFLSSVAHGQSYRAKVSGIVTDQTGAVVVGATVTLSNVNTGDQGRPQYQRDRVVCL